MSERSPTDESDGPPGNGLEGASGSDDAAGEEPAVKSYLVCPPARPIRLRHDVPVTIGRGGGNAVVLADSEVSRRHAVVEWRDGRYLVRDLGSRNGVYVNGVRVAELPLADDDSVRIGDRVFTFHVGDEAVVRRIFLHRRDQQRKRKTQAFRGRAPTGPAHGLSGSLADFGLGELLQALQLGRKTGRITVTPERDLSVGGASAHARGEILVCDGEVMAASLGDLRDEEAVYGTLQVGEGSFDFEAIPVRVKKTVRANTAGLLMEAFRRVDEDRRPEPPPDDSQAAAGGPTAEEMGAEDVEDAEARDPSAETHTPE